MKKVAILTIYYNRESYVDDSIMSLINQSYANIEIIAIDDGSTDGTLARLKYYEKFGVKVISQENCGFTNCLINVLNEVVCDYVAIHGSGDISHIDRIAKQVNLLETSSDYVLCGAASKNINQDSGKIIDVQISKNSKLLTSESFTASPPFTHGTAVFSLTAYRDAGGYDNRFTYSQDWDLWFRLLRIGKCIYTDEFLYDRKVLMDGASFNPKKGAQQIFFKHLALFLYRNNQVNRGEVIKECCAIDLTKSPFRKMIKDDLCRRTIKIRLMDNGNEADYLKNYILSNFGNFNLPEAIVDNVLKWMSIIGIKPSVFSSFFRVFIDFLRKYSLR